MNKRRKIIKYSIRLICILFVLIGIILGILFLYSFEGSGFNSYISPPISNNRQYTREKTLWDWLQLLIIPASLTSAAFIFNSIEKKSENSISLDNQRENAMQSYFDKISQLLLDYKLKESDIDDDVRDVARTRTLTVLRLLDGERKTRILHFLEESRLAVYIPGDNIDDIIKLVDADFSNIKLENQLLACLELRCTNFRGATINNGLFQSTNFEHANMENITAFKEEFIACDFNETQMEGAKLLQCDISGAIFTKAKLEDAKLLKCDLISVSFSKADIKNTDFSHSNLRGDINFDEATLSNVNFNRATLSDIDFNKATLSNVNFNRATLNNVDFQDADLRKASFKNAKLSNINLKGATYTRKLLEEASTLNNITWS